MKGFPNMTAQDFKPASSINPLHRSGALAVAVSLGQQGLEREWVAKVMAADNVTNKRLEQLPMLSAEERRVRRLVLAMAWKQLYDEAQAKAKLYPSAK